MAARRPVRIRPVSQVVVPAVDDAKTALAMDAVTDAVQKLQATRERNIVTYSLVVGTNKVRHGLGRDCKGYTIVPTVADATFAHALLSTNPRPDLEVWITVVGVAQPNAIIEVF